MKKKRSVSTRIAHYLFLIIIFAGIIAFFSMMIMLSNRSDAELINVSGSLRMQSYRLLNEMQHYPQNVPHSLQQYKLTLQSRALVQLEHQFFVPNEVKLAYHTLIQRWDKMANYVLEGNIQAYQQEVNNYVDQVDKFVYALQHFTEKKLIFITLVISISMLLIVLMVSYVIWFTRKKVVIPLHNLARASIQVQMGKFNHVTLVTEQNDEIGSLARVFTQMAKELHKLYMELEGKVSEKTKKLSHANRTLTILYQCSQQLTEGELDKAKLNNVLSEIRTHEHLPYIELDILGAEHWNTRVGEESEFFGWQQADILIENKQLGVLRWQAGLPCPDPRSMQNIAHMIGRSLHANQAQRQQQQLLLMEERSIIARELHDSLAQVLSFLQIQLTLLKHSIKQEKGQQHSLAIIQEFEQALSDGYIQLRELLATFRLTIQEANLKLALEQVIESLKNQTTINITLDCSLPSQTFNAQQLVHALQIVREATLNAIKHSQSTLIEVIAHTNEYGENELIVADNGIGIPSLEEPDGHYGLNIMYERSAQLNAKLTISNRPTGGTEVKMSLPNLLS